MKSYTASKLPLEKKIEIVEVYLKKGGSLRKIAHLYDISYMTLWEWVRQYKKGGKENLSKKMPYKRSNRRLPKKVERQIMLLKERQPSLTIKRAKQTLSQQGWYISPKGIWKVWKRYGLVNRPKNDPLSLICSGTYEIEDGIQQARLLIEKKELRNATKILNKLPSLSDGSILKLIPEKFLSSRRKLERLHLLFDIIPRSKIFNKAKRIRKNMEKRRCLFSSIFAGFLEALALQWMRDPEGQLDILDLLSKRMKKIRDPSLKYTLHLLKSIAHCELLQINEAHKNLEKCRRLLISCPYSFYWITFGDLLTFVTYYKKSLIYFKKALLQKDLENSLKQAIHIKIANVCTITGQYQQAIEFLKIIEMTQTEANYENRLVLINANLCFAKGHLGKAADLYKESLEKAKKANLRNIFYVSSLGLAQVTRALNRKEKAQKYLKKCLPLMKKHQMRSEIIILQFIVKRTTIPKNLQKLPILRLCYLMLKATQTLRMQDYYESLNYAKRKGLLGIFHRYIVFFPELVLHLFEKGKPTGLPRAILKFPIFNQKKPVYHIRLLGTIIVYKNQQYVKTKLMPKEKAFLIHLTLKAGEPEKSILSIDLYRNFWPDSKNPSNLLSHLLVTLKKKLRLPSHLLMVSSKLGESRLVNCGVHLTTDYNDLEIAFVQANALERAGEWAFAKREYLRAFRLFHGEPFKKIYDNWSEHMRRVILNKLETEGKHFARSCLEHGNKKDVKKVLEKVAQIIPGSEEIRKMASSFG
jgi:transposase/tetratricopeptide (TPR) repeat protein